MKPGKLQRDAKINVGRSATVHNLLFCAHTLWRLNYVTKTYVSIIRNTRQNQLCFQGQKSEQKHVTKNFARLHTHYIYYGFKPPEKLIDREENTVKALVTTALVSDQALVTTTIEKPRLNCHSNSVIKSSHKRPHPASDHFWELPTGLFLCFQALVSDHLLCYTFIET